MTTFREQRKHPRLYRENGLAISPIDQKVEGWSQRAVQVLSKDISAGGIRVRMPSFLPVGSLLKIEIQLHRPRKRLASTAHVRWIRRIQSVDMYEAGIQFDSASAEMMSALQEYVDQHSTD